MRQSRWALALGAGGVRGAYQAGALLCLSQAGVRFRMAAGTSIGAINGAYYVQGDGTESHMRSLVNLWLDISRQDLSQVNLELAKLWSEADGLLAKVKAGVTIARKLMDGSLSVLERSPFAQVLDAHLDYGAIRTSTKPLLICTRQENSQIRGIWDYFRDNLGEASYHLAQDLSQEELRLALLASAAIPGAFSPPEIQGEKHVDGGLADPLPAREMQDRGCDRILSIGLREDTPCPDLRGATLIHLRPSEAMERGIRHTLDFSETKIRHLVELGYRDMEKVLDAVPVDLGEAFGWGTPWPIRKALWKRIHREIWPPKDRDAISKLKLNL